MAFEKILNKLVLFSLTYPKQICYTLFVITNFEEVIIMAIGKRIKFIRKLRGMTQRQLGQLAGLSEKTADIRMAQYENGTRTPKEDLVKSIAEQLEVSPAALNIPDTDTYVGIIQTLFALEDNFNFKVDLVGTEMHLCFKASDSIFSFNDILYSWYKQQNKYLNGEITKEEYDNWRYNYPSEDDKPYWLKTAAKELEEFLV